MFIFKISSLQLHLTDLSQFDLVYRCQNSRTGAFKLYNIECADREAFNQAPLVNPVNQTVPSGSNTMLTCGSLSKNAPDSYQWFMDIDSLNAESTELDAFRFDLKDSIGNGPLLELKNVTTNHSGRVMCCALYSKQSHTKATPAPFDLSQVEYSCSHAELHVLPADQAIAEARFSLVFKLILLVSVALMASLILLVYCSYTKYNTYMRTIKATQSMHKVSPYQHI